MAKSATIVSLGVLVCGAVIAAAVVFMVPPVQTHESNSAVAASPLRCTIEPGFRAVYRLFVEARLSYDAARWVSAPNSQKAARTSVESIAGKLHARAVERRQDGVLLAFQLDPIERAHAGEDPVVLHGPWNEPFFAILAEDCRISSYGFAKDAPAEVVNRWQGLLQGFSMSLGRSAHGDTWISNESDPSGVYTASYTRDRGSAAFTKHRRRYLQTEPAHRADGAARVSIVSSEIRAALDAERGWLEHLQSKEQLRLHFSQGGSAELTTTAQLAPLSDSEPLPKLAKDLSRVLWRRADASPLAAATAEQAVPSETLRHTAIEEALSSFAALFRSGDDMAAVDALARYLRARPEQAQALVDKLARREISADLEPALFHALEVTGTAEAHAALLDALGDQHTTENRMRAAAALPDIPHPDQHTLDVLHNAFTAAVAREPDQTAWVRNAAMLAIGTLEQRTRESDSQLAGRSRDVLREALAVSKNAEEKAAVLAAIGNSGHPTLVHEIKPFLRATDQLLRSQAIGALRQMPLAASQDLFAATIQSEQDPRLRAKLADTLRVQARETHGALPSEIVNTAAAQLAREQDPRARASLIELIGPACAASELAVRALANHFAHEPDPNLLVLIGKFVPASKLGS